MKLYTKGAVIFLILVLLTIVGIWQLSPPASIPADAPDTSFSAERAIKHIEAIAQTAHPVGSKENDKVMEYILNQIKNMGLTPEIQDTVTCNNMPEDEGGDTQGYIMGRIKNVIVKIAGSTSSKSIAVVGHYDTHPTSTGANDDTSAVAVMLETIRVLKASEPLKNDVIFLFTDGEEMGCLGSRAFVEKHPWAKDVELMINFDSQGGKGPSLLLGEISDTKNLVKALSRNVKNPMAYSSVKEFYKILRDNADYVIFKEEGIPVLNFGYFGNSYTYHTYLDKAETIDLRSLQHNGEYCVGLLNSLGNTDPKSFRQDSKVTYFSILKCLVYYPAYINLLAAAAGFIMLLLLSVLGIKKKRYTLKGYIAGFISFVISIMASIILTSIIWMAITALHKGYSLMGTGLTYNAYVYLAAFTTICIVIVNIINSVFRKKFSSDNLYIGILAGLLLLTGISIFTVPGFSYLFIWPLILGILISFRILLKPVESISTWGTIGVLSADAVPVMLLFIPLIYCTFAGLGLSFAGTGIPSIGVTAVFTVLLLQLLMPQLEVIRSAAGKWMNISLLGIALLFIVLGSITSGFSKEHPRPNSVWYMQEADNHTATMNSFGKEPDEWTKQFFPNGYNITSLSALLTDETSDKENSDGSYPVISGSVPVASIPSPYLEVTDDKQSGDIRSMKLHISSPRGACILVVEISGVEIQNAVVNGVITNASANSSKLKWSLMYVTVPEDGMDVTLNIKDVSNPIHIVLRDISYQLPEILGLQFKPRPEDMIAAKADILGLDQSSIISKSYVLD